MSKTDVLKAIAKKYKRGFSTVKRWAATGIDITDADAVERYVRLLDLSAVGVSAKAALRRRQDAKAPKPPQAPVLDVKKALERLSRGCKSSRRIPRSGSMRPLLKVIRL
jgi:hypothetical protein